ncbi:MAG: putative O-sialoglycoprotein endopeptidase [Planctomycetota bacterium]
MERILAIESSCDETAAAVVECGVPTPGDGAGGHSPSIRPVVRSSVVASQYDLHAEYGGVVPEIASRAHLERLAPVVRAALDRAGVGFGDLTAVAAGIRPGLIGSLLVGTSAAKAIAFARGLPFLAVDHVVAHLFAGLLDAEGGGSDGTARDEAASAHPAGAPLFPALGLVVSGGHTSLFRLDSPTAIELVGRTIDDAVGEALDKAAAMLGLPHPGGPNLERLAAGGDAGALRFPVPRLPNPLDFSLSGLKTKLLYEIRGVPIGRGAASRFERSAADLAPARRADLAASFQRAAFAQVTDRLARAAEAAAPRALLVGGGVVANRALRAALAEWCGARGIALVLPRPEHCVDNAAMIGGLAVLRRLAGDAGDPLATPAEPVSLLARGLPRARTLTR